MVLVFKLIKLNTLLTFLLNNISKIAFLRYVDGVL